MGRVLLNNGNINQDKIEINLSQFSNGLYLLKTLNKDLSTTTYKISVINK